MFNTFSYVICFLMLSAAAAQASTAQVVEPMSVKDATEQKEEQKPEDVEKEQSVQGPQAPTLQMNGFSIMVGAVSKQKDNSNGKGGGPYVGIGASNIYFTAKGRSANGFQYKYRMALESYPGGKSGGTGSIYVTQNYIEFLDDWGVFQAGNLTGPEDTMAESGFNLMKGASSIDGTFGSLINLPEGVIGGVQQYGTTSKATKITYYTPDIQGFTVGFAWTPNTTRMGTGGKDNSGATPDNVYGNDNGIYPNKSTAAYGLNNISLGMQYKADFKSWNLALAAIYIQERSKRGSPAWTDSNTGNPDINLDFFQYRKVYRGKSMQYTAAVGFDKWRFATGIIHNGTSRLPKAASYKVGNAGKAWNVGGQYTMGAYQFALGYFNTNRQLPGIPASTSAKYPYGTTGGKAQSHIVSATIDFNALQGLKFFGEVDVFKMNTDANYAKFVGNTNGYTTKNTSPTTKNSGAAVIVGTKLSF
jgi:hypothetical protein